MDPIQRPIRVSKRGSVAVAGTHPAIPNGDRMALRFWGYTSGAVAIAGIISAFLIGWYLAPIGLVVAFLIAKANGRTAVELVAKRASVDPLFKREMMMMRVISED